MDERMEQLRVGEVLEEGDIRYLGVLGVIRGCLNL